MLAPPTGGASRATPRWASVGWTTDAASLTLTLGARWWPVRRSLARTVRRIETWTAVCPAIEAATADGTAHRHPFVWGRRRRQQPRRRARISRTPTAA